MKINKNIYIIVVVAIAVITMIQTVSLIGDDKSMMSIHEECVQCHGNVKIQLALSAQHSSFACSKCHPGSSTAHTNKYPECEFCHETTELTDTAEAHSDFVPLGKEGCIACHTEYNIIMNYTRPEFVSFTIINNSGNWTISNIKTSGIINLSYNALRSGGNHVITNVSCKDCHKDVFDAVSAKGHAVVIGKDGNQSIYHNISNSTTKQEWCFTCHSTKDTKFPTQPHSVRKTTCDECHVAYGMPEHPGNLYNNIKSVPHLYRSLVCISCKSMEWKVPDITLNFKVHQEPYFDVTMW